MAEQLNPWELGTNRDPNKGIQYNLTTDPNRSAFSISDALKNVYNPLQSVGSAFSGIFNGYTPTYSQEQMVAAGVSPTQALDMAKTNQLGLDQYNANSFDWTGAFNTGLSAFNTFKQNDYQDQMLDLYKGQIQAQNAEIARKNKTRSAWANAYNT